MNIEVIRYKTKFVGSTMEDLPKAKVDQTMPVAWQHNKNLPDCLIELYDKSLWTDVRFHCRGQNEDKIIHAHKIILAARSPVFQAIFFGPCAEGKDEVVLENTDPEILDLVLRYIYNDEVILSEENAASVLEMAHYYQVTSLVQFCADYLSTIITSENACETLALAMRYEVTTLGNACCAFTDKHAEEVLNSTGFLELSESCMEYVLKGDTFYADEDYIFTKAEEWATKRLEERNTEKTGANIRNTLGKSFNYLRLPTMTYHTFMKCTRRKGFFSIEEYEDIVDFINKSPDVYVKCNSCVARLPVNEELSLGESFGENVIGDSIETTFDISVSRDVKLTYVVLGDIQAYIEYYETYHKEKFASLGRYICSFVNQDFSGYENKVIKLESRSTRDRRVQVLDKLDGKDLSNELNMVIYCKLKCEKMNASNKTNHIEDREIDDDGDRTQELEQEDEDEEKNEEDITPEILYEQEKPLESTDTSQKVIVLKEPLFLTEPGSPYRVTIDMRYSCESDVKLKAKANSTDTVKSTFGHITVTEISGEFAGISELGFENISNR